MRIVMVSFVKQTYTNLELISKYSIFHGVEKKYKDNKAKIHLHVIHI